MIDDTEYKKVPITVYVTPRARETIEKAAKVVARPLSDFCALVLYQAVGIGAIDPWAGTGAKNNAK